MATFPNYKPVYSASKNSQPRTRIKPFGSGYEQRLRLGLNQNPRTWELTFNLSEAQADEVEQFLDARALDGDAFGWTPPGESTELTWSCQSWDRELFDYDRSRVTASFVQEFQPG